ncbi:MAG: DUF3089 domain-containing protein [Maricaulaceae bacterium]|nr:DUF3089 domain-containing protein [Maricaulaceae bacterium]
MSPLRFATAAMIAGAIVFLVLLAAAVWVFRDQIYQSLLDPGEPFQTYQPPPAPDYAADSGWLLRPDAEGAPAAVFFIHPTSYPGGDHWNAPADDTRAEEETRRIALPNYAETFRVTGPVFAPRYRQAALYAFMNNREDAISAREFAAGDVIAAFDQFAEETGDIPFVIAGAGQGGLHALAVLIRRVAADEALLARLAAAYVIDYPAPADLFEGPLAGIPPCRTPDSIRCIVAFVSAEADNHDRIRAMTERARVWGPDGGLDSVLGRRLTCVNPVLGAMSADYAPARMHRGAVAAEGLERGVSPAPIPAQLGAQCVDGLLLIDPPRSRLLRNPGRLGEIYRTAPFNLFYEDMRADVLRRAARHADVLADERLLAPELPAPEEISESPVRPID